jgi:hypothetical protein
MMNDWFGIAVLLAFSVAVSLFSQLHGGRFSKKALPKELGSWVVLEEGPLKKERRILLQQHTWPRRSVLVEQLRERDSATGKLVGVPSERVLERFWG